MPCDVEFQLPTFFTQSKLAVSNGLTLRSAPTFLVLLCMSAGTALAHLSHRNSVCLSVCLSDTRVDQSKMVQPSINKIFTIDCLEGSSFKIHKAFPEIQKGSLQMKALYKRG